MKFLSLETCFIITQTRNCAIADCFFFLENILNLAVRRDEGRNPGLLRRYIGKRRNDHPCTERQSGGDLIVIAGIDRKSSPQSEAIFVIERGCRRLP